MAKRNLARQWARTTKTDLDDYDGQCLELANDVGRWLDDKGMTNDLVYIESPKESTLVAHYPSGDQRWYYHAVILSGRLIHDGWLEEALPKRQYFAQVFPGQRARVEYRSKDG